MHSLKRITNLPLAVFLCALFVSGLRSENVNGLKDFTVLIDFEKYQPFYNDLDFNEAGVCANPETEEYRKCGNRCVLGCRHASSSSKVALSEAECDDEIATKCVEGCFCKDGLVRHQNKCIPAKLCPTRRNKAIEIMNEPNTPNQTENSSHMKSQNHTYAQEHLQAPKKNQTLMVQTQLHVNNPKIFGFPFFNRGCQNPFIPCNVPVPVIHNYESNSHKKENKHPERGGNRPNNSNQGPVVVHIHGDGSVEGTGVSGGHGAANNNDDNNSNNNNNNNSGGSGGVSSIPVVSGANSGWNNGCGPNGCGGQQDWSESGNDYSSFSANFGLNGGFPNFGNGFAGLVGTDGFTGNGGIRGTGNAKGQSQSQAQAQAQADSGSLPENSTNRAKTYNFGLYSLTFNPGGTRTLNIFGLGTYTFIADGTIISSNVGPKITIPFEMMIPNMETSQPMPNEFEETEGDEEQYTSEEEDEWQGNRYQTPKPQVKPQRRPLKKPQYVGEEEDSEEEQVVHKYQSAKPAKQNEQYADNQHGSYQLQYPNFVNPPYTMNAGAPAAAPVQFIPFSYYPNSPSNDGSSVTNKPIKKKPSENRPTNSKKPPKESNKLPIYVQKPITEYETSNKPPKKSTKKEKPVEIGKINPNLQPEQQSYFNYMHSVPNPNYQNQPNFNSESGYSSQNTQPAGQSNSFMSFNIPFNGQQSNGMPGFPPFTPNQQGFNSANDFSSQFAQNNGKLNQFNPFNTPFNSPNTNKMPYQINPTFNNPYMNQPFNGFNSPFGINLNS